MLFKKLIFHSFFYNFIVLTVLQLFDSVLSLIIYVPYVLSTHHYSMLFSEKNKTFKKPTGPTYGNCKFIFIMVLYRTGTSTTVVHHIMIILTHETLQYFYLTLLLRMTALSRESTVRVCNIVGFNAESNKNKNQSIYDICNVR